MLQALHRTELEFGAFSNHGPVAPPGKSVDALLTHAAGSDDAHSMKLGEAVARELALGTSNELATALQAGSADLDGERSWAEPQGSPVLSTPRWSLSRVSSSTRRSRAPQHAPSSLLDLRAMSFAVRAQHK